MSTISYKNADGASQPLNANVSTAGDWSTHHLTDNKIIASLTPTVTASSAYASGNVVGPLLVFPNAVRGTDCRGSTVYSVIITDKSANAVQYDLLLFDSNPSATTVTDKTNLTLNAADIVRSLGFITVPSTSWSAATSGGAVGDWEGTKRIYMALGTTSLYGILIVRGTPTYGSTSAITVRLVIGQD